MRVPQIPPMAGMSPLGFQPAPQKALAQSRADAPLRPNAPQEPASTLGGLFGDTDRQTDLIDAIRRTK